VTTKTLTLDAAWAAAEAELPDGWEIRQLLEIRQLFLAPKRQWRAEAGNDALYYRRAYGATPAAALLALAGVLQADR